MPSFLTMKRPSLYSGLSKTPCPSFVLLTQSVFDLLPKFLIDNVSAECRRHRSQDQRCPLPGKCVGRIPSFTTKRQRRAESPVRCDKVCPHFLYCTQRWNSFSKLEVIEGRLRSFSVAAEPQRLADPAQDVGRVLGLLEDLGEIIFDYQVR